MPKSSWFLRATSLQIMIINCDRPSCSWWRWPLKSNAINGIDESTFFWIFHYCSYLYINVRVHGINMKSLWPSG